MLRAVDTPIYPLSLCCAPGRFCLSSLIPHRPLQWSSGGARAEQCCCGLQAAAPLVLRGLCSAAAAHVPAGPSARTSLAVRVSHSILVVFAPSVRGNASSRFSLALGWRQLQPCCQPLGLLCHLLCLEALQTFEGGISLKPCRSCWHDSSPVPSCFPSSFWVDVGLPTGYPGLRRPGGDCGTCPCLLRGCLPC